MKTNDQNAVVEKLTYIRDKYGFSLATLSGKIGVSSATLSQILSGEYEYKEDNFVWQQVHKFIGKLDEKIYETKLLRVVQRMLHDSFQDKEIAVITSCSGAGKTTAIKHFCLLDPFAVHIRVNEVFTTKYLLEILMRTLDNPPDNLTSQQMFETISELLARKNRLIVIDEAERLRVSQLELLRDLYDQGNIGLCLVGLDQLRTHLQKGHNLRDNLVQLYSRVAYRQIVDFLEPADVKMVFDDKFPKHSVSPEMLKELSRRYKSRGGLRAILKLVNLIIKYYLIA